MELNEGPVPTVEEVLARPQRSSPYDPRFPNQTQQRYCWQNYVDYHRCVNIKGQDYEPCKWFLQNFVTTCPTAWVSKWEDQREAGTFPANLNK